MDRWGRDFNNAVKEYLASEEEEEDWATIASRFLEGRHMVLVDDVWYQWQGTFYEGVDDMHIKKMSLTSLKLRRCLGWATPTSRSSSPLRGAEPAGVPFLNGRLMLDSMELVPHT